MKPSQVKPPTSWIPSLGPLPAASQAVSIDAFTSRLILDLQRPARPFAALPPLPTQREPSLARPQAVA